MIAAAVLAILVALAFIPVPVYFFSPGLAEPLAPMITVSGGHKTEKGKFMLTSVFVVYAQNIYGFLYGLTLPHHQILPVKTVSGGLSDAEYNAVEAYMMYTAHQNAEIAALRYLHLPVQVKADGVYVVYVETNSPEKNKLHAGDVILAANHHTVSTPLQLVKLLSKEKNGQRVTLTVRSGTKTRTLPVVLINLPSVNGQTGKRAGIGLIPATAVSLNTPYKIQIHTGDIDGPSAGFMFSLEIINQLYRGGDLTKGYSIAGTGTISATGVIGQIGGVEHKVIAASQTGAQYFFVPKDTAPGDTNQVHAEATVRSLHLPIRVVPVHTLAQAVDFLKSLPQNRGKIA